MEQYVQKSAVVAEITHKIKVLEAFVKNFDGISDKVEKAKNKIEALGDVLLFIENLEVKEVDYEKDVRQILSLYYEGIKHYDDIIKNGGSDLAIKILDGVVDARELGIQYVIDKLKAQEGE